ncbi:thiamine pyrophosphate-binding protein [Peribacillus sp. NPDC097264]|uniref:thiamine pyrophosphate-binding protein n=1 Tax=Peribacillus sp. NPDC097264 TaxID=3390616 RepID=UPI003CFFBFD6
MEHSKNTVAELIIQQLQLMNVKRIYGVVGDTIIGLIDALANQENIKFIAVKHESVAALMASAEAKLTGGLGVCTATMGPGVTNLLNGLGDAYSDKAPVLAITGQAPSDKIGTDFQQYVNQQELVKPFASYSVNLTSPDAIIEVMHKAAQKSLGQRGVTHLSIPKDFFDKKTEVRPRRLPLLVKSTSSLEEESKNRILEVMKTARQPMILAGAGARGASEAIEMLADTWGAAILTSLGGKGAFEANSPNLLQGIGEGGNPYAKSAFLEADVVLLAGVTWWPEGYVPTDAKIIQIDSNFDKIEKSIPVEIGIKGNTEEVIPQLNLGLKGHNKNDEWVGRCREVKELWSAQLEQEGNSEGSPIHPARIIRAIERTIDPDAILAIDTGDVTVWTNRILRQQNQRVLFSGYWRTMGFGLPAAMAAKLAEPEKQVVAVVGDGGLQMTLADLLTAKRYGIKITIIVLNNESLQMERDKIKAEGGDEVGVGLTNPDFVKVAEACGWKGVHVEEDNSLEASITEALQSELPALVDIRTAQIFFPETE